MFTLTDLETIIAERAGASADASHTAKLLSEGVEGCARKFGEEAVETVIAAISGNDAELVGESADLLFHLLVVLRAREVPLGDVLAELQRRTAQSGLVEKAGRNRDAGK